MRTQARVAAVLLAAGCSWVVGAAAAHHSPSLFDLRQEVRLTGVITAFHYRNPHVALHLEVGGGSNLAGEWEIEAQSPVIMTRFGWTPASLARGDRVVVTVNPPRQPNQRLALGRSVLKADGTTLRIAWDQDEIRKVIRDQAPR